MKKFFVVVLSVVMCFAATSFFVGCTDTADLEARILELEQQLEDGSLKGDTGATGPQGPAGPQGPKGDSGVSDTVKIYKLGETAMIYNNGILMFSIRYATKATTMPMVPLPLKTSI